MPGILSRRIWAHDPTIYAPAKYKRACSYESFVPELLRYGDPAEPLTWLWSPAAWLDCDNCAAPLATPLQTTPYFAMVEDANGCRACDTTLIVVDRNCEVFVPNAFSPNADGINDLLVLYAPSCVESVRRWMVFDRWGAVVFEAHHFPVNDPAVSWDGKHDGKLLNPAVFVWMAELLLTDGRVAMAKGDVAVLN